MGKLFQTSKGQNSFIFNEFDDFFCYLDLKNDTFFQRSKIRKKLASQQHLAPPWGGGAYGTIWYHMVPYGTLWYHRVPYGTIGYPMVPYDLPPPPPGWGETLLGRQDFFLIFDLKQTGHFLEYPKIKKTNQNSIHIEEF